MIDATPMGCGFFIFFLSEDTAPSDGGIVWKKGDYYKKREPARKYDLVTNINLILSGGSYDWSPAEAPVIKRDLAIANMILWPQSKNQFSKQETASPIVSLRLNTSVNSTNTKGGTSYKYLSDYSLKLMVTISSVYLENVVEYVKNVEDVSPSEKDENFTHQPETRMVAPFLRIALKITSEIWYESGVSSVETIGEKPETITIIRPISIDMRISGDFEHAFTPNYMNEYDDHENVLMMFAILMRELENN